MLLAFHFYENLLLFREHLDFYPEKLRKVRWNAEIILCDVHEQGKGREFRVLHLKGHKARADEAAFFQWNEEKANLHFLIFMVQKSRVASNKLCSCTISSMKQWTSQYASPGINHVVCAQGVTATYD